jgi:hypothetical protein
MGEGVNEGRPRKITIRKAGHLNLGGNSNDYASTAEIHKG